MYKKTANNKSLMEIVNILVKAYNPERIYLFGSHARGDAHIDSDYDLMLIVSDNAPAELADSHLAYQVLWGQEVSGDILVWKKSDFEKRLHLKASFPSTIMREGHLLHAA